jgi:hypothetical protein
MRQLWAKCEPIKIGSPVHGYLKGRGIEAMVLSRHAQVSELPRHASGLPKWASWWPDAGYQLMVWLVDATGQRRGVRARRIRSGPMPKSLSPKGFTTRGLFMACWDVCGWLQLRNATTDVDDLRQLNDELRQLIIAEGEIDFLSWVSIQPIPVIGISAGSWTGDLAALIPPTCHVTIATHNDEAGDRYANRISSSLHDGCTVSRWRATGG